MNGEAIKEQQKKLRRYINLCPSVEETNWIYLEYENHRKDMVVEGVKPPALSRYLIEIILHHFKTRNSEGIANG